ncbi:MAG: hypothetical protein ACQEQV_02265 [Fibrobacterota bacterium]
MADSELYDSIEVLVSLLRISFGRILHYPTTQGWSYYIFLPTSPAALEQPQQQE